MMACPRCQTTAPPDAVVCPRCGYLLTAPPPPDPAAPARAIPQPSGSSATIPPRTIPQGGRSGGVPRKPWGWWGAGIAAAVLLGTALGWDVYLGQVQQIGAAWRQLNADAQALLDRQHTTGSSATPAQAALPASVASQVQDYADVITGTQTYGQYVAFPVTIQGPARRAVTTTAMVDTGNPGAPVVTESVAQQAGLAVVGETMLSGIVPGSSAPSPTYGPFTVIPQGTYVRGTPGGIAVPSGRGIASQPEGVGLNIGETVLAHARLVIQDGRWWFAWNPVGGSPPAGGSPSTPTPAPPSPAPSPGARTSSPPPSHTTTPSTPSTSGSQSSSGQASTPQQDFTLPAGWHWVTISLRDDRDFQVAVPDTWTAVETFKDGPPQTTVMIGVADGTAPDGEPNVDASGESILFDTSSLPSVITGSPGPVPHSVWIGQLAGNGSISQGLYVQSPNGAWTAVSVQVPPADASALPIFWQSLRILP